MAARVFACLAVLAASIYLILTSSPRGERARSKLLLADATWVVNPQELGWRRMATSDTHRHVADFLEDVLHEE